MPLALTLCLSFTSAPAASVAAMIGLASAESRRDHRNESP